MHIWPYTLAVFYRLLMSVMLFGDFLWWWWAHRRLRGRRHAAWWRGLLFAFIAIQLSYMLRILLTPFVPRHDSRTIDVIGMMAAYLWHLLILPATFVTMGVYALVSLISRCARRPKLRVIEQQEAVGTVSLSAPSRRNVLAGAAIALPPLLAGVGVGMSLGALHRFRVRPMSLSLRGLPPALDGMTIAHVSDTHTGRFTDDAMLRDVADVANSLDADLTLFTGDLIDVAQDDLEPAITFARRLRGRFGVFFCEGNHDLIEDAMNSTTVFEAATKAAGLPMLFDESGTVMVRGRPVQLIGERWSRNALQRQARSRPLMANVDPDAFPILLTHHPHAWDYSTVPLTLSGHTHGGQLMLNERVGVGPILFRYWSGLYRRGDQALVVSNGVGNWFPLRTCAPAEIIHLTLRAM